MIPFRYCIMEPVDMRPWFQLVARTRSLARAERLVRERWPEAQIWSCTMHTAWLKEHARIQEEENHS